MAVTSEEGLSSMSSGKPTHPKSLYKFSSNSFLFIDVVKEFGGLWWM